MKCLLTGKDGAPVDAHIIPRSFYPLDTADKRPLMVMRSNVDDYPKRSRIGAYDSTILTLEGERLLAAYDDHASEMLVKRIKERRVIDAALPEAGYLLDGVDYGKMKLFFISLLWRASVSKLPLFKRVSLGPKFEQRARELILANDPGGPEEFAVTVSAFPDKIDSGFGILDPSDTRFGHLSYYLFYLNHLLAYIKVDQRPSEPPLDEAILRPGRPLVIVNRGKFRESKEYPVMKKIVEQNYDFLPDWWKSES